MPAVLLVLATALGGVQLASLQLRLQDAGADAARMIGRGQSQPDAARALRQRVPGASLTAVTSPGWLVCANAWVDADGIGGLLGIRLSVVNCALAGGL